MNKKNKILIIIIVIFLIGFVFERINTNKSNVYEEQNVSSIKKDKELLSMNLEQTAGAGDYKTVTQSGWPSSGYTFNSELSKCENGGELSWDSVDKAVVMSGNKSDKCYIYFDKDFVKLSLDNYTFKWDAVEGASTYQIYSDGELLTTTSDTSAEIYGLYNNAGNYIISIKAVDKKNNVLNQTRDFKYVLEATSIEYYGYSTVFKKDVYSENAYYTAKAIYPNSNNNILFSNVKNNMIINYITIENYLTVVNYEKNETDKISIYSRTFQFNFDKNGNLAEVSDLLFSLNCNDVDVCMSVKVDDLSFEYNSLKFYKNNDASIIYVDSSTSYDIRPKVILFQFREIGKAPTEWLITGISECCLSVNSDVYVYDKKKKRFKKKKISDIDYDDELLCWDFDNGCFALAKPIWIMKGKQTFKYNKLTFSDGSILETINQHRIFNAEKGMFTYPMTDDTPIGTATLNANGEYVKLVSKEEVEEPIMYYNVMTSYHINLFANDILTSSRLSNIYPIKDLKYVCKKKRNNGYDFSSYNEDLVKGLRLNEQNIEETDLKEYVDNMINDMKW